MTLQPRVAIVHYWLLRMRGGERVLERLLRLYPQADIFTHVYDPAGVSDEIRSHRVITTFIQRLPGSRRLYQRYLPLMPMALEELDLSGYDLVISSEAGPAKGVITGPDTAHLCYCHSPMRYLWDAYGEYRDSAGFAAKLAMPWLFTNLRVWDVTSAARVDRFLANSSFIRRRIEKVYRRDSDVVFPPVAVDLFEPTDDLEHRYLWVGEMTPYKRADLAVEAFNRLGLPLLMVGDGPMSESIRRRAKDNISFIERLPFSELRRAYARCRALVFTAREDFGIVPAEAMAAGRPVLAYGRGGALDIVAPGVTGLFFDEQTPESLVDGVMRMEAFLPDFEPAASVRRARMFSPERFDRGVRNAVAELGFDGPNLPAIELARDQRA
ncbi:MAG TPA: glycosyltransferase [Caulobacteraceae bacterium]